MNKRIYNLVWNKALGQVVVASEFATCKRVGGSSASTGRVARHGRLAAALLLAIVAPAVLAGTDCSSATEGTAAANSVACGLGAVASGGMSVALGENAQATGQYSSAIGYKAKASATDSLAWGNSAVASGTANIAIGRQAVATGNNGAVVIGVNSSAAGYRSTVLGGYAHADQLRGTATGFYSTAAGDAAAFGYAARAFGTQATALGDGSIASGTQSTVLGWDAGATGKDSVALGSKASDGGFANAVALGAYSVADRVNSVSVGKPGAERQIANVADGTQPHDAVNVEQLNATVGTATANDVQYDNAGKTSVTLGGSGSTAPVLLTKLQSGALSSTSEDAVNGSQLFTTNQQVATNTSNVTTNTTSINSLNTQVSTNTNDITGLQTDALQWNGSLGAYDASHASGGPQKISNVADGTVAAGSHDAVNGEQLYAATIGASANSVQYDTAGKTSVTLGGVGATAPVTLTNLKAAGLSATSTDAVNGSQLFATNQQVTTNTTNITNNTASINTNTTNIGSLQGNALLWSSTLNAFDASHGSGSPQKITNVANGDLSATSTDAVNGSQVYNIVAGATADAVEYDSAAHDSVTLGGAGSTTPVVLTNIKAGALNATSNDAVNGSQLFATNQQVTTNTTNIANNTTSIDSLGTQVTTNTTDIANITNNITGLQGDALQWSAALGAYDASHGSGSPQKISNVAAGVAGTDAVNLNQLNAAVSTAANNNAYFKANGKNDGSDNASATGADAVAAGPNAKASGKQSVAIGNGSQADADNSVALGAGSTADRANTVSVGSAGNERQITNVAAGTKATDAVNVGQLNNVVGNISSTVVNEANTYTDTQVNEALITAKNYTDASSHQTLIEANNYTDQQISNITNGIDLRFNEQDKRINKLGAMGAAQTQMAINTAGLDGDNRVGIGMGAYNGQMAGAVGYQHVFSQHHTTFSAGVSVSGGEVSGGIGAGVSW